MSRQDESIIPAEHAQPFLSRWSQRKLSDAQEAEADAAALKPAEETAPVPPTDADMPPLDSLDETSDFSGFLSPGVSQGLRQLALRKLFSNPSFNVCDGLDDYAEDFTNFTKLGDIITADMRHRLQQEAEKLAQATPHPDDQVNEPVPPAQQASAEAEESDHATEVDDDAEHQEMQS